MMLPWIGLGRPHPHVGQRRTSLFGDPTFGGPDETKKARSVVALSRVPRGERGTPVFPPAAGQGSERGISAGIIANGVPTSLVPILSRAAVRPLVRMPTDQHATTGTCVIGRGVR